MAEKAAGQSMRRAEQVNERIASGWKWPMMAAVVLLAVLGGLSVRQFMALNGVAAVVLPGQ